VAWLMLRETLIASGQALRRRRWTGPGSILAARGMPE
jgi:hypothetical protein